MATLPGAYLSSPERRRLGTNPDLVRAIAAMGDRAAKGGARYIPGQLSQYRLAHGEQDDGFQYLRGAVVDAAREHRAATVLVMPQHSTLRERRRAQDADQLRHQQAAFAAQVILEELLQASAAATASFGADRDDTPAAHEAAWQAGFDVYQRHHPESPRYDLGATDGPR